MINVHFDREKSKEELILDQQEIRYKTDVLRYFNTGIALVGTVAGTLITVYKLYKIIR